MKCNIVCKLKKKSKNKLRNTIGAVGGDIGDGDAMSACRIHIDNIVAGSLHADITKTGQLDKLLFAQHHLIYKQCIGILGPLNHLIGSSAVIDREFSKLL